MILGIVGNEAAKFTEKTAKLAKEKIWWVIEYYEPSLVISGGCHLGGIDEWAIEVAKLKGIPTREFLPQNRAWSTGYKPRNILIAETCSVLCNIVSKSYPEAYKGMRFKWCYHCKTNEHVKSGGCWTMKYAAKLGKETSLIVIE